MKGGEPLFVFVRELRTLRLNIGRSWAALSPPWRNSSRRFRWDGWRSGWDIPQRSFPGLAFLWDSHQLQFRFRFCLPWLCLLWNLEGLSFFRLLSLLRPLWIFLLIVLRDLDHIQNVRIVRRGLAILFTAAFVIWKLVPNGLLHFLVFGKRVDLIFEKFENRKIWTEITRFILNEPYPPWTQSYNPLIRQERCRNRHADGLLKWGLDALYEISPTPHWTN